MNMITDPQRVLAQTDIDQLTSRLEAAEQERGEAQSWAALWKRKAKELFVWQLLTEMDIDLDELDTVIADHDEWMVRAKRAEQERDAALAQVAALSELAQGWRKKADAIRADTSINVYALRQCADELSAALAQAPATKGETE